VDRRWVRVKILASRLRLSLLAVAIILVLLNTMMIAGAANCAAEAPGLRCALAKFIAG
jgi:hypothetical protein